jgi:sec-independent protein translocase protein TatA
VRLRGELAGSTPEVDDAWVSTIAFDEREEVEERLRTFASEPVVLVGAPGVGGAHGADRTGPLGALRDVRDGDTVASRRGPLMHPVVGEIFGWEALLVLLLVVLLFGSSKLPGLARSLGEASREFRKGAGDDAAESRESTDEPPDAPPASER